MSGIYLGIDQDNPKKAQCFSFPSFRISAAGDQMARLAENPVAWILALFDYRHDDIFNSSKVLT
jgi:hypothetical protein